MYKVGRIRMKLNFCRFYKLFYKTENYCSFLLNSIFLMFQCPGLKQKLMLEIEMVGYPSHF